MCRSLFCLAWALAVPLLADATLEVRLKTPARIYLTNSKGELQVPPNSVVYRKGKEEHFAIAQSFTMQLPAGEYDLTAEKGPEYLPFHARVSLEEGARQRVEVVLPHRIPMNSKGWYSADLHNHRKLEEMPLLLMAEDLNFAPTLTDWIWEGRENSRPPRNLAPLQRLDATHFFTTIDKEVERLQQGPGAIDLIGLREPVPFEGDWLYPPNDHFARLAHQQGAYVDAEKIMWRDIPALAALGYLDFAGVVHNHFNRHGVLLETDRWGMAPKDRPEYNTNEGMALWTLSIYYRFLNCGFHLPVSAGSASGVMASPLGYNRVYAHVDSAFTVPRLLQAMKEGRSFATNGPMVFLTAGGKEPGETLTLDSPGKVRVSVQAETMGAMGRIEVLFKGSIVRTATESLTFDLDLRESGWIAARAFEKETQTPRFAQTSPVYIRIQGSSAVVPEDARFFIEWLEREVAQYRVETRFRSAFHRRQMVEFLEKGLAVYRQLAAQPGAPARRP